MNMKRKDFRPTKGCGKRLDTGRNNEKAFIR